MTKSRKSESKIHAKPSFSGVKRFFANRMPASNVGYMPAFA